MPRALATEQEQAVVDQYASGEPARALAKRFRVAVQTVYNILQRRGGVVQDRVRQERRVLLIDACRRGATLKEAAIQVGFSKRTAARVVRTYRERGENVPLRRGRPPYRRPVIILSKQRTINVDPEAATAFQSLWQTPFPYPSYLPDERAQQEIERLRAVCLKLDRDTIRPWSAVGIRLCVPFFPNRYHATSKGNPSAFDAWHTATELLAAIRFQIKHGDPVTAHRVLRAVTLRCRTPTVFRPSVARFVYERYAPPGGRVWDPCAGYGGRLLGAVAAGVHYIGTDVEPATIEGNRALAAALQAPADLYEVAAEHFEPPPVDLVFTSPPYFDRERYSHSAAQSWRGRNITAWLTDFLRPVIEKSYAALPSGGRLVLNIADIRERGRRIPLVMAAKEEAHRIGFVHAETLQMPLAAINRHRPIEPLLVFRKPPTAPTGEADAVGSIPGLLAAFPRVS